MGSFKSQKFRLLSIIVFLAGLLTLAFVLVRRYIINAPFTPAFTITSTEVLTIPGDPKTPFRQQTIVRYQKASGDWKEVKTIYNPDGSVRGTTTNVAQAGRGVFQIDDAKRVLVFISAMPQAVRPITEETLRKDPHFTRTESVSGYLTYVLHFPDSTGSGYSDSYVAPSLQGLPIKMVDADSQATSVIEPLKIEMGEPQGVSFAFPDYPVSYDFYQKKIQAAEAAGHAQDAERMRQVLRQRLDTKSQ